MKKKDKIVSFQSTYKESTVKHTTVWIHVSYKLYRYLKAKTNKL